MSRWPYNTSRWRKLRALVLSAEPWCRYCAEVGRTTQATEVDHIIAVARSPDLAFDQANAQPLCPACHNGAKQREEKLGERIGIGLDGVPLRGWD